MRLIRLVAICAIFIGVAAAQPVVSQGGVVNSATFTAPNAPGSLVSIFGAQLSGSVLVASSIPLSAMLGDVSVTFNGTAAPLQFVAQAQINAQLPWKVDSSKPATVVVKRGSASSQPQQVQVANVAPGIFTVTNNGVGMAWAIDNNDGSVAQPQGAIPHINTRPAHVGSSLFIYATGLGPVTPVIADGAAPCRTVTDCSGAVTRKIKSAITILVGGVSVQPLFAGLSPQFPGVNQVNFVIPSGVPSGNAVPLQIKMGSVTSTDQVTIAIQ